MTFGDMQEQCRFASLTSKVAQHTWLKVFEKLNPISLLLKLG